MEANQTPRRMRKNGTEQSCETCRKAKLKCDHATPCGRCARLKRECVYHPSPLSRNNGISKPQHSATKRSPYTANGFNGPVAPTRRSGNSLESASPQNDPVNLRIFGTVSNRRRHPAKYDPGYMGKTAHSAILNEHRADLCDVNTSDTVLETLSEDVDTTQRDQLGAAILSRLPSKETSYKAIHYFVQNTVTSSLHLPSLLMFHDSFWNTYGPLLQEPRRPAKLMEAARKISQITLGNPLPSTFPTSREFLEALKGRWELIGVLFTCFEHVILMLPCSHDLLNEFKAPEEDRKEFCLSLLEGAESCLRLIEELDSGLNLMVMFLSYRCSGMVSRGVDSGDTSFQLWARVGQLCSTATALGLHRIQEPDYVNQSRSILYVEQQKRLMALSFAQDKQLSIFLGRPPCLSKRYVTTRPLLDASDDSLVDDDYFQIKSNLNEFGYNKQGHIYRSTLIRAIYASSFVYEDILEMSLGNTTVEISRVRAAKAECEKSFAQLPPIFHEQIDREWITRRTVWELTSVLEVQLCHLHQLFLLGRIEHGDTVETQPQLQKHSEQMLIASDEMLAAAEQLLNIVLIFWTERDQYPEHVDDVFWSISSYGIPAASALAIGLWKSAEASGSIRPPRNRSEIIQSISLFIACLDWVSPKDGNYMLCHRTKGLLKDILDRILSPTTPSSLQLPAPVFSSWDAADFSLAGMPNFGMDIDDLFSDEWLNAPRMNFN